MAANYYCDGYGVFKVIAMYGDQVDPDFDPEDLMNVQERYGGKLPNNYCRSDPYTERRMIFRCLLCECELTSLQTLEAHKNGKKHVSKVMARKRTELGLGEMPVPLPRVKAKAQTTRRPMEDDGKTLRELLENCGEAVIGLEYVKEYFPRTANRGNNRPVYSCKQDGCKSAWGSSVDMFNHVKNALHLKNTLLKAKPDDNTVVSMSKNDVIIEAGRFEREQGGAINRNYDAIEIIKSDSAYYEIANRPRDWSEKKSQTASSSSANLVPVGKRSHRSNPAKDRDSASFFEPFSASKQDTLDDCFKELISDNNVLLRILKKSLERASQEGAEKTTEMKERIKAKIDLVDMSLKTLSELDVPLGSELDYQKFKSDVAVIKMQYKVLFPAAD